MTTEKAFPLPKIFIALPLLPAWILANQHFIKVQLAGYKPLFHNSMDIILCIAFIMLAQSV